LSILGLGSEDGKNGKVEGCSSKYRYFEIIFLKTFKHKNKSYICTNKIINEIWRRSNINKTNPEIDFQIASGIAPNGPVVDGSISGYRGFWELPASIGDASSYTTDPGDVPAV